MPTSSCSQVMYSRARSGSIPFRLRSNSSANIVFEHGADMPLHKPFYPLIFNGFADNVTGFWVCHPAVDDIDTFGGRVTNQFDALFLRMPLKPFAAETNFADLKFRFSESSYINSVKSMSYLVP